MIYLDYAATTPISEKALQTYEKVARDYFGNPSSLHDIGGDAQRVMTASREMLASLLNADPKGIYFTGGGSEANYLAVSSIARGNRERGKHLLTTRVEHPSMLHTFRLLEAEGFEVEYIPVDAYGVADVSALEKMIRDDTILVSVIHANSEIGTVQPLEKIGRLLRENGVLFHSDCVQSFCKIPLHIRELGLHSISISSHKIYGPKGVGACYIDPSVRWRSAIPGTTQERGFRPGTANVAGIAAFAAAAEESAALMAEESQRLGMLRTLLWEKLRAYRWDVVLEGHPTQRLPHHLSIRIPGMEGQYALLELNRRGIAVSTGTACRAGEKKRSETMAAIGKSVTEAGEMIRITLGRLTNERDIISTCERLADVCRDFFGRNANSDEFLEERRRQG